MTRTCFDFCEHANSTSLVQARWFWRAFYGVSNTTSTRFCKSSSLQRFCCNSFLVAGIIATRRAGMCLVFIDVFLWHFGKGFAISKFHSFSIHMFFSFPLSANEEYPALIGDSNPLPPPSPHSSPTLLQCVGSKESSLNVLSQAFLFNCNAD